MNHDLYKNGDANIPEVIKDRNGEVALRLCKRCGRAECELDEPCLTQQEQLEALAEQNRLLKEALLKLACLGHGESYGNSIGNCIAQDALAVPDLSTSILNQRDARTLREAAEWFYKFGKDQESEPDIAAAQQLERMAAEKEKA